MSFSARLLILQNRCGQYGKSFIVAGWSTTSTVLFNLRFQRVKKRSARETRTAIVPAHPLDHRSPAMRQGVWSETHMRRKVYARPQAGVHNTRRMKIRCRLHTALSQTNGAGVML